MIFGLSAAAVLSLTYFLLYKYHEGLTVFTTLLMGVLTLLSLSYGVTGLTEYVNTLPSGVIR